MLTYFRFKGRKNTYFSLGRCAQILLISFCSNLFASETEKNEGQRGVVALGSFTSVVSATQLKSAIEAEIGLRNDVMFDASIVIRDFRTDSGTMLKRVLAVPGITFPSARKLVEYFKVNGHPGAWFLNEQPASYSVETALGRVDTAKSNEPEARERSGDVKNTISAKQQFSAEQQPLVESLKVVSPATALPSVALTGSAKIRDPILDHLQPVSTKQTVLGHQGSIPFHRITIPNRSHEDAGIVLDGKVDEAIWQSVNHFDNMIVSVPATGETGSYPTETRLLATEKGLYVSGVMYQPVDTLVKRYSVRDDFIDRDTFGFTLDMSGEGLVGYWFIIAFGDSIMDGKVLPERNYQRDWDGPWIGKSAQREDGWSVEMFLPWSMMNMPETGPIRNIGFALSRQISHANERYQWPGYPYSSARFVSALNQADVSGVKPRSQMSAIPFISTTSDLALETNEARLGVDLSWKPSPKLEMTASLNPDFGAVEADDVVLNLKAAEVFIAEKRLFFLEGNEVFDSTPRANTGNIYRIITNDDFNTTSRKVFSNDFVPAPISLMNTRRIGGAANQVTLPMGVTPDRGETDRPTQLLAATKVVGQVGEFRYGVLGAVEDDVFWYGADALGNPTTIKDEGREFAVARLLYEDVGTARKSIGYLGTLVSGPLYDASVHSMDAHYTRGDGKLILDGQLIHSDIADQTGEGALFDLLYNLNSNWRHKVELEYMDDTVRVSDFGFLRRNDYGSARYVAIYNKQRVSDSISNFRSTLIFEEQRNISEQRRVGGGVYLRTFMVLPNRYSLRTSLGYFPKRWEDIDSRGNGTYRVKEGGWWNFNLATDAAKVVSLSASLGGTSEDTGAWTSNYTFGATIRPFDSVSIDIDARYKQRRGWLVYQGGRNFGRFDATEWQPGLKLNWFITPSHQLRLSVQWAGVTAEENGFLEIPLADGDLVAGTRTKANHDFTVSRLTTQFRYRWEIAPLSDFFLVYNLGNALPDQTQSGFEDLFIDTLDDPTISTIVAKLRFRFGN
ncbi:MAG: hypothetical protein ACJAVI_005400 [Candidatus Azotimanducaceae bacterium]